MPSSDGTLQSLSDGTTTGPVSSITFFAFFWGLQSTGGTSLLLVASFAFFRDWQSTWGTSLSLAARFFFAWMPSAYRMNGYSVGTCAHTTIIKTFNNYQWHQTMTPARDPKLVFCLLSWRRNARGGIIGKKSLARRHA